MLDLAHGSVGLEVELGLLAGADLVQDAFHHAVGVVREGDFDRFAGLATRVDGHVLVVEDLDLGDVALGPRALRDDELDAGLILAFAGAEPFDDGVGDRQAFLDEYPVEVV